MRPAALLAPEPCSDRLGAGLPRVARACGAHERRESVPQGRGEPDQSRSEWSRLLPGWILDESFV